MSDHAPLPPSSAHIWRVCTGQPLMLRKLVNPLPKDDTPSREGTAAHWAANEMLHDRMVAEGQITPEGVVLTPEMIESAEVHVAECQRILRTVTTRPVQGRTLGIELRTAGISQNRWGTPDFWMNDVNARIFYLRDLKHGWEIVEVFECYQLMEYAAHLAHQYKLPDDYRFDLGIVQPRAPHRDGPVRNWVTTAGALKRYWHELDMAEEEATGEHAQLRPNSGCKNCDAVHECPALLRDNYRSAQISEMPLPFAMSTTAIGLELVQMTEAAARIKARIAGLEAQADAALRAGSRVLGWTLDSVPGRLDWTVPAAQAVALGGLVGLSFARPPEPITPTQAKAMAKGDKRELVAKLVDAASARPPGAMKLTRDDGSLARRVFGS